MCFIVNKQKVIFICLLSLFINCFAISPKRADAVVTETVTVGGVVVSTEVIATLVAGTMLAGGACIAKYEYDKYGSSVIGDSLVAGGMATKNFAIKVNDAGQKFLTWTQEGLANFEQSAKDFFNVKQYSISSTSISFRATSKTMNDYSLGTYNYVAKESGYFWVANRNYYIPKGGRIEIISTADLYSSSRNVGIGVNVNTYYSSGTLYDKSSAYCAVRESIYNIPVDVVCDLSFQPENADREKNISCDVAVPSSAIFRGRNSVSSDKVLERNTSISVPLEEPIEEEGGVKVANPAIPFPTGGSTWDNVQDRMFNPGLSIPQGGNISVPGEGTGEGDITIPEEGEGDTTGSVSKDGIFNIPILGAILKALLAILELLKSLVSSLIDALISALQALLTALFVPADNFFVDKFNGWKDVAIGKLGDNNLNFLQKANSSGIRDIYVDIAGKHLCIVKLSIFENVKDSLYGWLKAFFYFLLILFNFNKIIKMLKGSIFSDFDSRVSVEVSKNDYLNSKFNGK